MLIAAKTLPAALFLFLWSTIPSKVLKASDEALNRLKMKNVPYLHRLSTYESIYLSLIAKIAAYREGFEPPL